MHNYVNIIKERVDNIILLNKIFYNNKGKLSDDVIHTITDKLEESGVGYIVEDNTVFALNSESNVIIVDDVNLVPECYKGIADIRDHIRKTIELNLSIINGYTNNTYLMHTIECTFYDHDYSLNDLYIVYDVTNAMVCVMDYIAEWCNDNDAKYSFGEDNWYVTSKYCPAIITCIYDIKDTKERLKIYEPFIGSDNVFKDNIHTPVETISRKLGATLNIRYSDALHLMNTYGIDWGYHCVASLFKPVSPSMNLYGMYGQYGHMPDMSSMFNVPNMMSTGPNMINVPNTMGMYTNNTPDNMNELIEHSMMSVYNHSLNYINETKDLDDLEKLSSKLRYKGGYKHD